MLPLLLVAPALLGYTGRHVLRDPIRNRGTAFSPLDREAHALVGLLPAAVESVELQLSRCKSQFDQMPTPISKYLWLRELEEDSTSLFYEFVAHNLIECLPVIYTPTVGEACVRFSELWRRPKGVFITASDKGRMRQVLDNVPMADVHIIVVTDGGRILGLGDQGANGMGIPIGKVALYVAGGGFDPAHALPVQLDFGTNNEALLADPLYIGARHRRLPNEHYYELVDEFLGAVKDKWPKCLVQFEDFATHHSLPLLERYRSQMLCFNDDIQGTGSVILGGLLNALKAQGNAPKDAKIVFYGAGSAAVGCAQVRARAPRPGLIIRVHHMCSPRVLHPPLPRADDRHDAQVARRARGGRVQTVLDDGLEGPPHRRPARHGRDPRARAAQAAVRALRHEGLRCAAAHRRHRRGAAQRAHGPLRLGRGVW